MRLTVVIDATGAPDDEQVRKDAALDLRLLSSGRDGLGNVRLREGNVRNLGGAVIGRWKIEP